MSICFCVRHEQASKKIAKTWEVFGLQFLTKLLFIVCPLCADVCQAIFDIYLGSDYLLIMLRNRWLLINYCVNWNITPALTNWTAFSFVRSPLKCLKFSSNSIIPTNKSNFYILAHKCSIVLRLWRNQWNRGEKLFHDRRAGEDEIPDSLLVQWRPILPCFHSTDMHWTSFVVLPRVLAPSVGPECCAVWGGVRGGVRVSPSDRSVPHSGLPMNPDWYARHSSTPRLHILFSFSREKINWTNNLINTSFIPVKQEQSTITVLPAEYAERPLQAELDLAQVYWACSVYCSSRPG